MITADYCEMSAICSCGCGNGNMGGWWVGRIGLTTRPIMLKNTSKVALDILKCCSKMSLHKTVPEFCLAMSFPDIWSYRQLMAISSILMVATAFYQCALKALWTAMTSSKRARSACPMLIILLTLSILLVSVFMEVFTDVFTKATLPQIYVLVHSRWKGGQIQNKFLEYFNN